MAPKARVTQLTAIRIERAQDAFLEALEDGVFCHTDQARIKQLLTDALTSASKADLSAQIAVGGMRGSIDGRHHQDLVNEFVRLDSLLSPLTDDEWEPLDAA